MPKILTNRRVQFLSGACLVVVLLFVMGSMTFAGVIRSSKSGADSFLRSSISSRMYTADGGLLANLHGEIDRDPVSLERMALALRQATVAIEDRRFYSHRGIDVRGLARAFLNNLHSDSRQGGSTISSQLAKNLYFHGEPRTIWRKASEAVLALGIEGLSSKEQILDAYLNTTYFGRGTYGVQAAARSYFRKDVSKLTVSESAFLAGLIHMPARYDFTAGDAIDEQRRRREAAIARRNVVLDKMADVGYLSGAVASKAKREAVDIRPPRDPRWTHPYFIDAVLRELGVLRNRGATRPDNRFDFIGDTHSERAQAVYREGLRIYTTLDTDAQRNAEAGLKQELPEGVLPRASAALVSVEPGTGYVRALIGGRDYYPQGCDDEAKAAERPSCRHAKVNLALGSLAGGSGRQPGSSFKPIVLASALEHGLSLKQTLDSSPFTYKYDTTEWKVQNYEGGGGGSMSVVDATVKSVNAAYARLEIQFLGDNKGTEGSAKVAETARKLGITLPTEHELRATCGANYGKNGSCTPADAVPAIALGAKEVAPIEMAAAYAAFANDGVYARPTLITKITNSKGKVLYTAKPETRRAVSSTTAKGVAHVLQQAVERGTGTRAALADRPVAGKTGTSQAWRDAWFDGYIPQLATVVWVGNPVPVQDSYGNWAVESMTPSSGYGIKVTGGSYPARIWNAMMAPTTDDLPVRTFPEAPESLFGNPKDLDEGDDIVDVGSGLRGIIELERSGANVVVHRVCPPGGGTSGIQNWKTEKRGNTTHVYRSRAVCR